MRGSTGKQAWIASDDAAAPRSLGELLALRPVNLAPLDIALINLLCAESLPGAEDLSIPACLATLDRWTDVVRRYTRDCTSDYQRDPARYGHHKGFFKLVSMAVLLKRGIRIAYQPRAIGNFNFSDSRDDLLHGLLTRKLGTCASLPVLCVAIGRRLDYPMHLAIAKGHVLCQWLDADGSHVNFEISGNDGECSRFEDEHYHVWPRRLTPHELASGRYLRPLTPAEELALFLETRGHCLTDNERFDEAAEAYGHALRLAPDWSQYHAHMRILGLARDRVAGVFCRDVARTPLGVGLRMTINSPLSAGFQVRQPERSLRMAYHPTLGRWMQRDPAGYVDGTNLYEYVGGSPTGYTDPSGLLALDTTNRDIRDAYNRLENSRAGQRLLEDIGRLEGCANQQVRIILSPSPGASSRPVPGRSEIQIWMNPYDQIGAFPDGSPSHNLITGPRPTDFRLGTELDALLYHELQHALFYLIQSCGEKRCIKVTSGADEEDRITALENEYRREKRYPDRYKYDATDEQKERIREVLGGGHRGGPPLSGPPDFDGEKRRRERERRRGG